MKPFLKWAGGKRQLHYVIIPIIKDNLSQFNTYYEPFVGAGSVFLELAHQKVVINDANEDLMMCYREIKMNAHRVLNYLDIHKNNHSKEYFYQIRSVDRDLSLFEQMTPSQRAARVIYLNKTCFNGLYRVNKRGQFNTPFGSYKNPNILDRDNISSISEYLKNNDVKIRNVDFAQSVFDAKNGDFIYFDPPYDYEEKGFSDYQKEGFTTFDLERLKRTCDDLIDRGCHVLISNHATKKVIELFSEENYELIDPTYLINFYNVKRYIGSKQEYRKYAQEVLIHGWKKGSISTSK